MVPNAKDDLPEPETPVNATIASRGTSTLMFRRLFSRAPRTRTNPSSAWAAAGAEVFSAVNVPVFCLACTASTLVGVRAWPELSGICRDGADGFTLKHYAAQAGEADRKHKINYIGGRAGHGQRVAGS